jgi:hypothetical protein
MESPVVEELQKELVEAIGIVHAYCDQEIRDACLPPSPEQPLLTMANPMAPEAPEDEQRPGKVWVFFHTGGRKLFRMMDGDAPEQHEQHEHDESHERHSGHKQGKPGCHKTTQSTPFFGAENSDANQCVEDMFTSDALSDECKVAVNNALVINDALNQEILAEEYVRHWTERHMDRATERPSSGGRVRALGAACEGFHGRGVSPRHSPSEAARFRRRRTLLGCAR